MCPTVHGLGFVHCGQIAWKKWPTNWHAHVSRWLMLSCHWQLWVLLPMSNHLGFFLFFIFFFLRLGLGQRRSVVIIGRWLLPSLVDTGDICCHYWQHILVLKPILLTNEILRVAFAYLVSWRQSLRVDGPKASQHSIITYEIHICTDQAKTHQEVSFDLVFQMTPRECTGKCWW